jgi:hypothetical protein
MRETEEIRRLVTMAKWLFVVMIVLIIVELVSCAKEAKAGTITGDTPIAGISLLRQQAIDKGVELPETEDIKLLAEVIYHENWHTDEDHKAAYYTGAVVLNRVSSSEFPNSIKGVLYQKNPTQYSTTHKFFTKELPQKCYQMAIDLLKYGTPDVPKNVVYQATFRQGSKVWKIINGEYFCYE